MPAGQQEARLRRRLAALAARETMSPVGPASDRFRLATWNLNSLRARLPAVERFLVRAQPDVLCLQETKAPALSEAASALFDRLGYRVEHVGAGTYNGVAIASRFAMSDVEASGGCGEPSLDREPRLISCVVASPTPVRVASVYVPHGRTIGHWHYEYKLEFLAAFAARAATWLAEGRLIVGADVNVAATDSDVFHPDAFVGRTHVTTAERESWSRVLAAGLVDIDVVRWGPHERRFTWWDHGIGYSRNLGMRLDVIAADRETAATLDTTWIDHIERGGDRPSDHAALIADFGVN